ncbi:MAG TPA: hypothetical protein VNG12_27190 [Acidimicrobiales bacterium]|nr:hypothetical protein [Acidimicrobiales bacterium]
MTTGNPIGDPPPHPQHAPGETTPEDAGTPYSAAWEALVAAQTVQPPPSRRRRRLLFSGIAVTLSAVVVASILVVADAGGPSWPSSIAPIAAFVSKDRHLTFLHAVPVRFVDPKTFDKEIARQDQPANASQRADIANAAAEYRALGLIGGAVNLDAAQTAVDSGSVLAYYDDQRKDVVVRGTKLDPATKVTIAHELTHTLQDQHFNLNRIDNGATTADSSFAVTALEEGDAVNTQGDYESTLPISAQRRADAEMNSSGGTSSGSSKAGPTDNSSYLNVSSGVPYVLGPDFNLVLYAKGGEQAVNHAFVHPPTTELDIVNPAAYLLGTTTRHVPTPALPRGSTREGSPDSFGAFDVYMVLSGYADARTALLAADGWGGGTYVQFRHGAHSCTNVDLVGRSAATGLLLQSAFESWARDLPLHQASVSMHGSVIEVTACDPGKLTTVGTQSRDHAVTILDERNSNIGYALLAGVTSPTVALCFGDQALGDKTLLQSENSMNSSYSSPSGSVQKTFDTETKRLVTACERPHPPPAA